MRRDPLLGGASAKSAVHPQALSRGCPLRGRLMAASALPPGTGSLPVVPDLASVLNEEFVPNVRKRRPELALASDWHGFLHRGFVSRRRGEARGGALREADRPISRVRFEVGLGSQFPPFASLRVGHGAKKRANRMRPAGDAAGSS